MKYKYLLYFDGIFSINIGSKSTGFFWPKVKLSHYLRPHYKFDYSIKQAVGQNTINIRNDSDSQKGKKIIFFAFTFGPEDEGTFLGKGIGLR